MPGSPPLTNRDAVASSLMSALCLAVPGNDGPLNIDPGLTQPKPAEVQSRAEAPPNGRFVELLGNPAIHQLQ